jgi:hypothetical protein
MVVQALLNRKRWIGKVVYIAQSLWMWPIQSIGVGGCHMMSRDVIWWHHNSIICCHTVSSEVMWSHVIHVMWCHLMAYVSYDVIWCHVMPYYVRWCHMMSYDATWCHTMPHDVIWCHAMSYDAACHMLPFDVTWSLVMPYDGVIWCLQYNMMSFFQMRTRQEDAISDMMQSHLKNLHNVRMLYLDELPVLWRGLPVLWRGRSKV